MDKGYRLSILHILLISFGSGIMGVLLLTGIMLIVVQNGPIPVCHSKTEDSVITDCSYRNGTWYRKW